MTDELERRVAAVELAFIELAAAAGRSDPAIVQDAIASIKEGLAMDPAQSEREARAGALNLLEVAQSWYLSLIHI